MATDLISGLYIVLALTGCFVYNYAGYLKFGKPKGESYDWSKFLDTVMKGGFTSAASSAAVFAPLGFNAVLFGLAFVNGMLFSAGIDKIAATVGSDGKVKVDLADAAAKGVELATKIAEPTS